MVSSEFDSSSLLSNNELCLFFQGTCDDYAELGEGYDEEDSFIDNTEAVSIKSFSLSF